MSTHDRGQNGAKIAPGGKIPELRFVRLEVIYAFEIFDGRVFEGIGKERKYPI